MLYRIQFRVKKSSLMMQPELYISVLAHTSLLNCSANQVLNYVRIIYLLFSSKFIFYTFNNWSIKSK